jgi:AcrR family transcriptional regulator
MATQPLPDLKLRLIEAAIDQFGRAGFDGASTRDIAAASGTTMSSITYHFGGKQGLYLACADYIADQKMAFQKPLLAAFHAQPPRAPEEAITYLMQLIENFARGMLAADSQCWSQFIAREQQQPTEAFERIYARVMAPVLDVTMRLMKIVSPAIDDARLRTLVLNVIGMVLALRLARATTARVMQVDDIDEATAEILIAGLRRSALVLLMEA